ncbi:serine/threonine-protein kinase [Pyxidicoccus xibeiensis]|uniref:serine/threonine-protein kinase n=1 Tax=Pyxidicoccus xibeiensis TaxID=2906759 RepID=UPI002B216E66|nr:protein kinase [Pyxidicoccus xibeiensis]
MQFGRYELQARIGRGGMAETWRARLMGAAGVTKPVLIKKVLPEYANDEAFLNMFISEARISATLSHGSIAQVFDFGEVDGDYFLAMEFVDGQPLHRIIKRALRSGFTCLPAPVSSFIALAMCKGLHYAHTRTDDAGAPLGIVHRDISPDNVLISYEGQVKIVDFGIAKARLLRGFDTAPGVVKGKYLYFSPEQARGEQVDARTDVWATGVVLFNMVCGRLPLEGQAHVVMHRLTRGEPMPRARSVNPDVPQALDAILQKALALKKEDRFESAHALGDALAGFLYTSAPRFSDMSVAYLMRELFRPDMAEEGRDTRVPASFVEELSVWRTAPPMPKSTDVELRQLSSERRTARTDKSDPGETPELEEDAAAPDGEGPPEAEGGLLQDGIGMSTAVAGVAVLAILGLLYVTFTRLKSDWMAPEEPRPSGPPPTFLHVPRPAPTQASAAPKPSTQPAAPVGATWPVDSFQLEARQHVIRVSSGSAALASLDAEGDWRLEETTVVAAADRGSAQPTLFYLLTGKDVAAASAVGTVSRRLEVLRGASGVMLFTVGPPLTEGNLPERQVTATSSRTGKAKDIVVHPEWMTASVERAFVLSGLLPQDTYLLTLEPVGEGAFTRGREQGPALTVACMQHERPEEQAPERAWRFLLSQGDEVRIKGMRGVACGFVDDEPSDNEGAVRVRVEKSRPLSEWGPVVVRQAAPRSSAQALDDEEAPPAEPTAKGDTASAVIANVRALLKAKKYHAARQRAQECVSQAPKNADCHLLLGSAAARVGQQEESVKHYRRFLELAPATHPQASQVLSFMESYEKQ